MAEVTTTSREDAIELIIETEFPSVSIEDIEFLSLKVQQGLTFEAALQAHIACEGQIASEGESVLAAAHERLRELERLTDGAIQDVARPIELNIQAEERRRLLLEDQKLFDAPAMEADFEHYRPLAYWDMHEATCLLLGKDPRRLKQSVLLKSPGRSPFAERFRELTGILTRAAEVGLIGDEWRIEPARLVPWALSQGIDVPETLATAFRRPGSELRQGLSDGNLESSIPVAESSSTGVKTAMPYAELEKKVEDLDVRLRTEKSANSKWRKTTLLIMYGLLHANFKNPPRDRPVSVGQVRGFLDQVLNRGPDENTVRSRLKEIEEIVNEHDELQTQIDQVGKADMAGKQRN